jgi:hypothetical protein
MLVEQPHSAVVDPHPDDHAWQRFAAARDRVARQRALASEHICRILGS